VFPLLPPEINSGEFVSAPTQRRFYTRHARPAALLPRAPRVLAVTRDHIRERSGDTYLGLADHELLLPAILAELLAQLPCSRPRSTLPEPDTEPGYLFPGRTPSRSVDAGIFANRLKRHGINPRAGRNTAPIRLASELPAAVLADLLGIDVVTATRWAGYAKRDWQTYLAERRISGGARAQTNSTVEIPR
jgi:hypothetical protein